MKTEPTTPPDELGAASCSEFLRFHGERPEKYLLADAEPACGNCKYLKPDYSHPCTDGHSILKLRGWICDHPELGSFSGWSTEGGCECHDHLSFPNAKVQTPPDPVAAETAQITESPAVDLPRIVSDLGITQDDMAFVMRDVLWIACCWNDHNNTVRDLLDAAGRIRRNLQVGKSGDWVKDAQEVMEILTANARTEGPAA